MPLINAAVAQRPDVNLRGKATFGDILAQNAPTLAAAWLQYRQNKKDDADEGRANQQKFLEGDPQVYGAITNEIGVEGLQSIYKFPPEFAQGIYDTVQQNGMGGPTVAATDPALAGTPIDQPTLRPPTQQESLEQRQAAATLKATETSNAAADLQQQLAVIDAAASVIGPDNTPVNRTQAVQIFRRYLDGKGLPPGYEIDPAVAAQIDEARGLGLKPEELISLKKRDLTARVEGAEAGVDATRAGTAGQLLANRANRLGYQDNILAFKSRIANDYQLDEATATAFLNAEDPMTVDLGPLPSQAEIAANQQLQTKLFYFTGLGLSANDAYKLAATLDIAVPAATAEAQIARALAEPHLVGLESALAEERLIGMRLTAASAGRGNVPKLDDIASEIRLARKNIVNGRLMITKRRENITFGNVPRVKVNNKSLGQAAIREVMDGDFFVRFATSSGADLEAKFADAWKQKTGDDAEVSEFDRLQVKRLDSSGEDAGTLDGSDARGFLDGFVAVGSGILDFQAGLEGYQDALAMQMAGMQNGLSDKDGNPLPFEDAVQVIRNGAPILRDSPTTRTDGQQTADLLDTLAGDVNVNTGALLEDDPNAALWERYLEDTP